MHSFRITLALLSVLALPAAARAATFDFTATGSGGGFSGSGVFIATPDGGGEYTITGISGTFIDALVPPGGFNGNDNLLFPFSSTLVDAQGFAFTATQTTTDFTVDIFSSGPGTYDAYLLDNDGFSETIPVTFSVTVVPEPSNWLLLGTGILGLAGMSRRRLLASSRPIAAWRV
jgi:hypothetical protein